MYENKCSNLGDNQQNRHIMKKEGIKRWIKAFLPSKTDQEPMSGIQCQKYIPKEEEDWTEAEAEIINHLINMDSILRITKQLDYYYEYITLVQINQTLCQQTLDLSQTKKALLGGLHLDDSVNARKYTTKNLPYQYYSLRCLLWKINLQYLGTQNKTKWVSSLQKNLLTYWNMVQQFIVFPVQKKIGLASMGRKKSNDVPDLPKKDHPLNFSQESKWKNYFKDRELWQQIQKDIKRTRKNCPFFAQPHIADFSPIQTLLKPEQITFLFEQNKEQTYADCLTRIIFIYLKRHPEEYYCQGMNEFVALIFYCFTNKNSQYLRRVSESDAYFIFELVMGMLPRKHFQKGADYVKKLNCMLLKMDFRLHEEINKQGGIQTLELLTMRWFLTGFLSEYSIDDCLQLWDVVVCWPDTETAICDKFMFMGLAMVHLNRERIMEGQNIASILSKVEVSAVELAEKSLSLFKIFPKLVAQ